MTDFLEDPDAYPVMIELAATTQNQLVKNGLPPIDKVTIQPGAVIVADYVGNGKDCGEIIINLITAYPSNPFPQQTLTSTRSGKAAIGCGVVLAYQLAVSVLRCAPVMTGTKQAPIPPTMDVVLAATRLQMADMQATRTAICQALNNTGRDYQLGAYTPVGADGGVVGGTWALLVAEHDGFDQ